MILRLIVLFETFKMGKAARISSAVAPRFVFMNRKIDLSSTPVVLLGRPDPRFLSWPSSLKNLKIILPTVDFEKPVNSEVPLIEGFP